MSFTLFTCLAFTVVLPVIAGAMQYRQVLRNGCLPVFLFVVLGLVNNILSYSLIRRGYSNHFNSNIYVLISFGLLLWQFSRWNASKSRRYLATMGILGVVWVADNFALHHLRGNNSIFRFVASFTVLFLCVDEVSRQVFLQKRKLWGNAVFLICIALLSHYTFKAFFETFNFFAAVFDSYVIIQLNRLLAFADLVTNLLISIAFLCLRYRPTYYPSWPLWP